MAPAFEYIQCDIPEGVSIRDWRRSRNESAPRRHRLRTMLRHVCRRAWL